MNFYTAYIQWLTDVISVTAHTNATAVKNMLRAWRSQKP